MKKCKFPVFLALGVAGFLMVSCGSLGGSGKWAASENSIYVTKKLEVQSAMVFTSAEANELYNQEELAEEARGWIKDYNVARGAAAAAENQDGTNKLPVALKSCRLEGQTGALVFDYGSPEDFVTFAQTVGDDTHTVTSLTVGAASEVLTSGNYSGTFTAVDGAEVEIGEVTKQPKYKAVAVEGAGVVFVEGKVKYVSAGDTVIRDAHTAVTGEGMNYIIFQ
ncbi:MAG: hypothetical protein HFG54_03265 [Lachnospiraceae bacterium]|nr:hypothetical protein [Lachnospiraceae bacterium]